MMVEQRMTVCFTTPAFLGDAGQKAAWRTPAFKALLRQWWRVVAASRCGYDHRQLREEEGCLFGHAWLKDDGKAWSLRSLVRLRLEAWSSGRLGHWPSDPQVQHPEVGPGGRRVGAHLYLGYGPLVFEKGAGTKLKAPPGINAGEKATLALAYPENEKLREDLADTLQLVAWFGTLGGRSRNGWGSLELTSAGLKGTDGLHRDDPLLAKVARSLDECLSLDWPHALGRDDGGLLVWRTASGKSWQEVMKTLAEVKIAFRTKFPFNRNLDVAAPVFEDRHLLAYPVTNHGVLEWSDRDEKTGAPKLTKTGRLKQTERLAGQLRFKVLREGQGCVGIIFHVPCRLPGQLEAVLSGPPTLNQQAAVWQAVHAILDGRPDLQRL
jgi:CRISPR-associated protein Cmr1